MTTNVPRGRDEIRAAVIAAARQRFAREGLTASLRDIAADAGVNLGLVHRHFGSKDALVRAVFTEAAEHGRAQIASASSFTEALDRLVASGTGGNDTYGRMLALLLLDGAAPGALQDEFPTIARLRELGGDAERPLILMLLLTNLGFSVFGGHLAAALGYASPDDAQHELLELAHQLAHRD
jgi:AcrR family transcriptional regulator